MRPALPAGLLQHPGLWQGRRYRSAAGLGTGHPRLDRALPDGGWPVGALTELLAERVGVGEFSLLLPALAELTARGEWAILVDPPWTPYPPAIRGHGLELSRLLLVRTASAAESLWACEQGLRGLPGGAVLAWLQAPGQEIGFPQLRRLQLAAHAGRKAAFLFRPITAAGSASPAALRLYLHADPRELHVRILKCRGGRPGAEVRLRRPHQPAGPLPRAECVSPEAHPARGLHLATPGAFVTDALH